MAAETFEQRMERACKDLEIPGAILAAGDKEGKIQYKKAFGQRSLQDPSKNDPMSVDDTMWIASCTKFLTTICALQCVERGQLKLDDEVYSILPELKDLPILKGFNERNEPILEKNTKPITLRLLLTHSSGLSYDIFNPMMMQYRIFEGKNMPNISATRTVPEAYVVPLLFAPGEGWEYSGGIDMAGAMVERVNNNISLEDYMHKNLWEPLGVTDFTFFPKTSSSRVLAKFTDMSLRDAPIMPIFGITTNPEAKVVHFPGQVWNMDVPDCHGGAGGHTSPVEYLKVLQSIASDDEKLLKISTVDEMYKPQLTDASRQRLMEKLTIPQVNLMMGGFPQGTPVDWGLGGLMNLVDFPGRRRKGSICWGGHPNLVWLCDRTSGLGAIMGTQIQPPGDKKVYDLFELWERDLYAQHGKEQKL